MSREVGTGVRLLRLWAAAGVGWHGITNTVSQAWAARTAQRWHDWHDGHGRLIDDGKKSGRQGKILGASAWVKANCGFAGIGGEAAGLDRLG